MNSENVITSSSNPRIKKVSSLLKKSSLRKKENVYVVEGLRMVTEAPRQDIISVYVSSDILSRDNSNISLFLDGCKKKGVETNVIAPSLLKGISETVTPQGVVAVVKRREEDDFRDKSTFLILEDIQDPGNLGTLIRTAEAAGMDMVIMSEGCVDIYNPKVIRSTMGTIYRIPYYVCKGRADFTDIIREIKDCGVRIYGGCLTDSKRYTNVDMTGKCGIVIGNEGNGITDETLGMIEKVHIPMKGEIESLNASVAGSILMYEINRQRTN